MLESLIYIAVALLTVLVPVIYINKHRVKSKQAAEIWQESIQTGHTEPVSLHPVIDPDICIGSGSCVDACPEQTILGLINNRGQLVSPSKCIGHGQCAAACPVQAITLVFGTEKRGVDIPHLKGTFETNVSGIYIAGELGGMGLIRNAVTQGKQAVENIAKSLLKQSNARNAEILDLVIVGAGPAGISGALKAKELGLNFEVVDRQDLGGTIYNYPRRKLVMTQPMELPLYGKIKQREMQKEKLMEIFSDVIKSSGLKVREHEKVESINKENGHFRITTVKDQLRARRVLLAIGRRGIPRQLGVPGEKSSKVTYKLLEPELYTGCRALVVGGGDSAIEAALALCEQEGNVVHMSYRQEGFYRLKEANRIAVDKAIAAGLVKPIFNSELKLIEDEKVTILSNGEEQAISNDQTFIFAGGELPTEFLKSIGIEFTRKFGEV